MKKFVLYSGTILGNSILIVLLLLDLAGAGITYFHVWQVPAWVFAAIPVIGIYLAGYQLFRHKFSLASLRFCDVREIEVVRVIRGTMGTEAFVIVTRGYVCNSGTQTVSLDRVNVKNMAVNAIRDPFILERLNIEVAASVLVNTGADLTACDWYVKDKMTIPFILKSNVIIPFKLCVEIKVNSSMDPKEIKRTWKWIRQLDFDIEYSFMNGQHENSGSIGIKIPIEGMAVKHSRSSGAEKTRENQLIL